MSGPVPVTFEPAGITVWAAPGATVLEAARLAGIIIAAPCGGRGVCGSCGVRVVAGALDDADAVELAGLSRGGSGIRLACRARISQAVTVRPVVLSSQPAPRTVAGEVAEPALVAGVDLGTTSIAATLIDLATGQELARASVPNPQQVFGADVLSRLSASLAGSAAELRARAEQGISAALETAASTAGVSLRGVQRLAVAGNSAMTALLAGADVTTLAVHPFVPPLTEPTLPQASPVLGLLSNRARTSVIPAIAGFVGGDALAATVSAGMIEAHAPILLIDFGTNAEIVLAHNGRLVVASAAAGPAFEGVGVSCGGPAASGAVTGVRIGEDGSVAMESLGSQAPQWFSGSGLVSVVAELRRRGHVDESGRLQVEGPLSHRFSTGEDGVVRVGFGEASSGCLDVTQLDIRALQLAKAAVRVGVGAVLAAAGVTSENLESVLVAGAFGSALEPGDLIELGVLPAGVAEKTRRVGNASLDGAAIVALDPGMLPMAVAAATTAVHVELAQDEGFARALMDATEFAVYSA